MNGTTVRSPLLPGGDLIAAVLDRTVMNLADRGGASNLVGARWADLAAANAKTWTGQERPIQAGEDGSLLVQRVVRLDDISEVAAAASRRGLQNPDLLLIGTRHGRATIQAADAKFSVETARAKQVSPTVVQALLDLGDDFARFLGETNGTPTLVPGVFLSPDFPLTHLMLERRQGILRTTVHRSEVVLVPVNADDFFRPLEGESIMRVLAQLDNLPLAIDESLLAGLYYFRLARAAVGCWLDATKPLLLFQDHLIVDEPAVNVEAEARAQTASSAFDLVQQWHVDVEVIRSQRLAVDQVAMLPITNRELRAHVQRIAEQLGADPPSLNQVRRRLGAWFRGELRARVGPLTPPVADLTAALTEVARAGADVAPQLDAELARIMDKLTAGKPPMHAEPAAAGKEA